MLIFGPNSAFNSPSRERLCFPGGLIQQDGIARSLRDLTRPGLRCCVVVDSAVAGSLTDVIGSADPDLVIEVSGEPATRDVVDLASRVPSDQDFEFVAVGGGSTIDRVKALYMLRATGHISGFGYGDLRQAAETFVSQDRVIAVPTLPGSGAESSRYVVLADDEGRKRPSRSWKLVPEVALLDPSLLSTAPDALLVMGAFDAFVHSWETLINREEYSPVLAPIARGNLSTLVRIVTDWVTGSSALDRRALQMAAAIGGVLISNSRVGLMHTVGEGYARFVHIPHPKSLALFLPAVASTYDVGFVEERTGLKIGDVLALWGQVWAAIGLAPAGERFDQIDELVDLVMEDRVLLSKEHPGVLDETVIRRLISESV